ncbi:hypothetical protein [Peribacillus faecalis]|nr:hypothetical protein [Peribacillus faecalis]
MLNSGDDDDEQEDDDSYCGMEDLQQVVPAPEPRNAGTHLTQFSW